MNTPTHDTRERYLIRAAKYVNAHVSTTDGRCGEVIATSQRRGGVIMLVVRSCEQRPVTEVRAHQSAEWAPGAQRTENRSRIFRTDNEHATLTEFHRS